MYFPGIFLEIESKIANINSDSFLTPANKNFILKFISKTIRIDFV